MPTNAEQPVSISKPKTVTLRAFEIKNTALSKVLAKLRPI